MTRTAIYSFLSGASCAVGAMITWVRYGGDVPLRPAYVDAEAASVPPRVEVQYIDETDYYFLGESLTITEYQKREAQHQKAVRDRVKNFLYSMTKADRAAFLATIDQLYR